jgi:hemin uptake protein HemP
MQSGENKQRDTPSERRSGVAPAGRNIPVVGDRMDSRDLFIGTREIIIAHGGESYRLRLTAQNRLILTK